MQNRKAVFYKWEKRTGTTALNGRFEKVLDGQGVFLGFGTDFEELNHGVGQFTTGIIELHDGTMKSVPVEMIQFMSTNMNEVDDE